MTWDANWRPLSRQGNLGLMSEDETRISEEQARELWRRAAELQAEAARRLEERSRQLAPRGHAADPAEVEGYRLEDVRAAAVGAGISSEFLDRAFAESVDGSPVDGAQARLPTMAARFLGHPPLTLEVSRVIRAPAEEVYAAMQRMLPKRPFLLTLVDHHGADPLDGGVLVFKTPAYSHTPTTADQSFAYEMALADLKQLLFSLRRLETSPPATESTDPPTTESTDPPATESTNPPATELSVQASLTHGQRLATWVGGSISAVLASLGGIGGGFVGATAGAALGVGGLAAVAAAAGFLVGGVAAMRGWRGLHRWGVRRGEKAIRNLIGSIAVDIETGGGFSSPRSLPNSVRGFLPEDPEA